ncbi:RNA polymerase, sigma 28 subunit, SigD/FliA/WhiG [Acidothermus cellulolyticus 11B]|jgi:RNA polymerase sigma factor for flagellar operon FliA|uniref:RNA polymerase, sigma 28 subunit, SigD/FliA/WhiG n=1 Tax=Acidothermus cellulolyticus (strain ATCC 43068 / DSM 8971 / 11B) TaxID=351607 RepID=A0LWJ4_ACIC1|nr:sigma-70 family RNA polymerase sigma factor [Acidothermus cellulolyticus]ABK53804.1 RNA polymerase, sigma 28 subunit, SigD/FliA/WhiG [Acidothermus cellulolyticus 11B]MCL6551398.1 sigma-70 family RNA polymerase sigma factor [Acidothermus cellulolyticus]
MATTKTPREQPGAHVSHNDTIDQLVKDHLPLVGYLVAETASKLPGHVNRDDLTSAGMMALAQAARTYDPSRGVPFARFATVRIRGAIIDELRSHDWASRSVRVKARQRAAAEEELAAVLGRLPTQAELAEHLGVSVDELASTEGDVHRAVVLSLQGFADAGTLEGMLPHQDPGPEDVLLNRERVNYLLDAVAALPPRLRTVVEGYFFQERPMAELAEELGVTESRISQMRAEALSLLRDGMTAMLAPEQLPEEPRPDGCVARRKAAYYAAIAASSDFRTRISARHVRVDLTERRASA